MRRIGWVICVLLCNSLSINANAPFSDFIIKMTKAQLDRTGTYKVIEAYETAKTITYKDLGMPKDFQDYYSNCYRIEDFGNTGFNLDIAIETFDRVADIIISYKDINNRIAAENANKIVLESLMQETLKELKNVFKCRYAGGDYLLGYSDDSNYTVFYWKFDTLKKSLSIHWIHKLYLDGQSLNVSSTMTGKSEEKEVEKEDIEERERINNYKVEKWRLSESQALALRGYRTIMTDGMVRAYWHLNAKGDTLCLKLSIGSKASKKYVGKEQTLLLEAYSNQDAQPRYKVCRTFKTKEKLWREDFLFRIPIKEYGLEEQTYIRLCIKEEPKALITIGKTTAIPMDIDVYKFVREFF